MDLYTLGADYRRQSVVDSYESLIWTERYAEYGDFELVVSADSANRETLPVGTWLAINESQRLMKVRTVDDSLDADGRAMLTIKGLSMEAELEERMARQTMTQHLTQRPTWNIRGWPANIVRYMFEQVCLVGVLSFRDVWPNTYSVPPPNQGDRIPEPVPSIEVEIKPQTLYSAIKDLCDSYDMGFRVLWNNNPGSFQFQVYTGFNRTTSQDVNPVVIFSPDLDNLRQTSTFSSIHDEKNVVMVISDTHTLFVYGSGAEKKSGLDRRGLILEVTDIPEGLDEGEIEVFLYDRGMAELAKHREQYLFDGEIQPRSQFRYGRDYELGDLVELRNYAGEDQQMMVIEQIFVSDGEGVREFPTLAMPANLTEGTWRLWPGTMSWADAEGDTWASMP